MLENKLNLQAGDVIATIEETWNLPLNTEGVITRVIASGVGIMLAVDFDEHGSCYIRPGVARLVERPRDLCADWDANAYALRIAAQRRTFIPLVVNVRPYTDDPGA